MAQPGVGVGVAGVGVGVDGVAVGPGDCGAQYLPPVFKTFVGFPPWNPPQTIISPPVQTAVWYSRAEGALAVLVAIQLSVPKWYLPPVSIGMLPPDPPQTIISPPVETAV